MLATQARLVDLVRIELQHLEQSQQHGAHLLLLIVGRPFEGRLCGSGLAKESALAQHAQQERGHNGASQQIVGGPFAFVSAQRSDRFGATANRLRRIDALRDRPQCDKAQYRHTGADEQITETAFVPMVRGARDALARRRTEGHRRAVGTAVRHDVRRSKGTHAMQTVRTLAVGAQASGERLFDEQRVTGADRLAGDRIVIGARDIGVCVNVEQTGGAGELRMRAVAEWRFCGYGNETNLLLKIRFHENTLSYLPFGSSDVERT